MLGKQRETTETEIRNKHRNNNNILQCGKNGALFLLNTNGPTCVSNALSNIAIMDHFWSYNPPPCPNAVQWSGDNHLAVACAHTACILAPGHLDGPRAYAAAPVTAAGMAVASSDGLCVEGVPAEPQESESLMWAVAGEVRAEEHREVGVTRTHVRSLAWSAPGCTAVAGCFLAMATTDSKVRVREHVHAPTLLLTFAITTPLPLFRESRFSSRT
jgi:hypothetical protein